MNCKLTKLALLVCTLLFSVLKTQAQVYFKSEYITSSKFKDENGKNVGGKGGLNTIDAAIRIPLSLRMDGNNKPTAWAIALTGTYATLDDHNLSKEYFMSEVLNSQIGLMHLRPISEKWSILTVAGVGIFTSDLNKISEKAILGQGGILFIKHARPNLDWGVGAAINNALGYPMLFPSLYLDWRLDGIYSFKLSMYDSFQLGLSSQLNDHFKLGIVGESKGLMSAVKRDGKNKYFVTQYGYAGIQPEYKIVEGLNIFATGGVSFKRVTYFQSRTLKAFYQSRDSYPHFGVSAYFAAGIKYGF